MKELPKEPHAFGLFEMNMIPKINRLLKPHGVRLKVQSCYREWGDQVAITVVPITEKKES